MQHVLCHLYLHFYFFDQRILFILQYQSFQLSIWLALKDIEIRSILVLTEKAKILQKKLIMFLFSVGQRLKEAGNINKSLMVLGQCMETLRLNQLKAAIGKVKKKDTIIIHNK